MQVEEAPCLITGLMDQIVALECELAPYRVSRSHERVAELVRERMALEKQVAVLEERCRHYKALWEAKKQVNGRLRAENAKLRAEVERIQVMQVE